MLKREELIKKTIKMLLFLIEMVIVFTIAYFLCKYINRYHTIKALHKDDVENYIYYLRDPDIRTWIFKKMNGRMHYRPFFYIVLFFIFKLITGNIPFIMIINFFISAIISVEIYLIARSLKLNRIISLSIVVLYTISPFAYYNIYQAIGCVESFPIFYSLLILILCIHSVRLDNKYVHLSFGFMGIFYFLLIFTHERYFPTMVIMLIALKINKKLNLKYKIIYLTIFLLELIFFFVIRHYYLGIWIPRGTACTLLLEHLDLKRAGIFILMQICYIFGINLGDEPLCAKNIFSTSNNMKIVILIQAIALLLTFILYIRKKKINNKSDKQDFSIDIFILVYIFFCILQSSLTIRLELRWVYASFTAFMIYFGYMITYLIRDMKGFEVKKFLLIFLAVLFVGLKVVSSSYTRQFYDNIHILYEQKLTNRLAELTVYKYGIENIKNKDVYILTNNFHILTDLEYEHFFDTFDGIYSEKRSINIENDKENIYNIILKGNYVISREIGDRDYEEF